MQRHLVVEFPLERLILYFVDDSLQQCMMQPMWQNELYLRRDGMHDTSPASDPA